MIRGLVLLALLALDTASSRPEAGTAPEGRAASGGEGRVKEGPQDAPPSGRALIDAEIRRGLEDRNMAPSPPCEDAEFLRRAWLDIAGTIPSPDRAERFLNDPSPDRRARLVEELLASPDYARNWSEIWASAILGVGDVRFQEDVAATLPETLRPYFEKHVPLDEFARQVVGYVTAPPAAGKKTARDGLTNLYVELIIRAGSESPQAFAGKFARVFLGRPIHCARCHDHPFDRWTQEEFYGMAAFFAGVVHEAYGVSERAPGRIRGLAIPGSKEPPIAPVFLDTHGRPGGEETLRAGFARLLTDAGNAQFSRAVVNRVWSQFFGRGLVHPVDGFSAAARPSHPGLLDRLSRDFQARGYDPRWLIREICGSEAYGRSARGGDRERERSFATAAVRALRPEPLVNALFTAAGVPADEALRRREPILREFRRAFGYAQGDGAYRYAGGIPSALLMLNGPLSGAGTRLPEILRSIREDDRRLRAIYLAALSRFPRPAELSRHRDYVRARGEEGFADVFASLLNSSEFLFNH